MLKTPTQALLKSKSDVFTNAMKNISLDFNYVPHELDLPNISLEFEVNKISSEMFEKFEHWTLKKSNVSISCPNFQVSSIEFEDFNQDIQNSPEMLQELRSRIKVAFQNIEEFNLANYQTQENFDSFHEYVKNQSANLQATQNELDDFLKDFRLSNISDQLNETIIFSTNTESFLGWVFYIFCFRNFIILSGNIKDLLQAKTKKLFDLETRKRRSFSPQQKMKASIIALQQYERDFELEQLTESEGFKNFLAQFPDFKDWYENFIGKSTSQEQPVHEAESGLKFEDTHFSRRRKEIDIFFQSVENSVEKLSVGNVNTTPEEYEDFKMKASILEAEISRYEGKLKELTGLNSADLRNKFKGENFELKLFTKIKP